MSELLIHAKKILSSNRTAKAARDLMTDLQRDALSEDYASRKQCLAASHFHSDVDKRKDFERLFREHMKPKGN